MGYRRMYPFANMDASLSLELMVFLVQLDIIPTKATKTVINLSVLRQVKIWATSETTPYVLIFDALDMVKFLNL